MTVRVLACTMLVSAFIPQVSAQPDQAAGTTLDTWTSSPEALFLTDAERKLWRTLQTQASKEAFVIDYWAKRDPDSGTPGNEFRSLVQARIEEADARFTLKQGVHGSITARGRALILLGRPSVIRETVGPLDSAPRYEAPGSVVLPNAALGSPRLEVWVYDRAENPELLRIVRRPVLEIAFVVTSDRNDLLQSPLLFSEAQAKVAANTLRAARR
jgi:GWxTD domain-containing protein